MDIVARSWAECFAANSSIQHCDLRHNNFSWTQLQIINEGLAENSTIFTFDLSGNEGHLDENGILVKSNYIEEY